MSATGNCPGCGSPLVFRVDTSVVAVCTFCKSVVARGDAKLEDLGKTNDILSTGSVLTLGLKGKVRDAPFELVGRTQLQHELGGTWDEWYAAFSGKESWGWIAEHQGRFAFTVENAVQNAPRLASIAAAQPGARYMTPRGQLVVAERGTATVLASEGELPWRAAPGERRAYVDLSGPDGSFATLDFGAVDAAGVARGPKRWFFGRECSVDDLGLRGAAVQEPALRKVAGKKIACPRCQAPLELKTDDSKSIACPSCASVLSVEDNGELGFLFAQSPARKPWIPLGKKARLDARFLRHGVGDVAGAWAELDVEVVAFVVRSVEFDGERFTFAETLLHSDKDGYTWLVESDGHWSLVKNVPAGSVVPLTHGQSVRYGGALYKPFQDSQPRVEQVLGELYWKVSAGEESEMRDYIRPPFMLSSERTDNEENWTRGVYVDKSDVERTFGVKLQAPTGVGANQPSPTREVVSKGMLPILAGTALCALVAALIPGRVVVDNQLELPPVSLVSAKTDPGVSYSLSPLKIKAARNVVVDVHYSASGWLWVDGSFFKVSSGAVHPFSVTVDSLPNESVRFGALPSGYYTLNLKLSRQVYNLPSSAHVVVTQGHPGVSWVGGILFLMMCGYVLVLMMHAAFGTRRMQNSTFGGTS